MMMDIVSVGDVPVSIMDRIPFISFYTFNDPMIQTLFQG